MKNFINKLVNMLTARTKPNTNRKKLSTCKYLISSTIMNKTIYFYESRGSNKRLTALKKMNEYLNLGYNIVIVPPVEQGVIIGNKSHQFYIDEGYFDLNEK